MTQEVNKDGKFLHRCEECNLLYHDSEKAQKCEEWCKEHHSCNLELIKDAVEAELE